MLQVLFSLAAFISAFLLFVIQPMVGRMLLPSFGGAAAVWNTCLVFFQGMLFAAYAYAHFLARGEQSPRKVVLHLTLLLGAFAALYFQSFSIEETMVDLNAPAWSVLRVLLWGFAIPLLALGASAPLLQRWFSISSASNPYWLYVASNVGSFAALAAYPLLIERKLDLTEQGEVYTQLFGCFVVLLALCAVVTAVVTARQTHTARSVSPAEPLMWNQIGLWSFLAFLPSGLLVGVTTHLTNDVAPVPLLWVVPLALYLLSFIIAFSGRFSGRLSFSAWGEGTQLLALCGLFLILPLIYHPLPDNRWLGLFLHLLTFFLIATNLHLHLFERRPELPQLTGFYLTISFGGMLGGLIGGLLPPLIFDSALEYPLLLAVYVFSLAPLSRAWSDEHSLEPNRTESRLRAVLDLGFGLIFLLIVGGVILLGRAFPTMSGATSFFIYAVCCLISLYLLRQRIVGIGLGAVLILVVSYVSSFYDGGDTLVQKRSFFGVKRVLYDAHADRSLLIHGRIIHGLQNRAPDKENVPLAYYAENGPLGQVIGAFGAEPINIGVVGLGAGSLAAYASHARQMVFYEIDPDVEVMARDPRYFTFMKHCGDRCQVILGDGRLQLQHAPAENFGLLVLDAFSSDSVPVHLLSAEAVSLYLSKLSANGVLMFNASNKFLHIDAVIAAVADSLHLPAYVKRERDISPSEKARGRFRSTWVMIPKNPTHQPPEGYLPLTKDLNIAPWTDRYSNLFSVIRW